MFETPSQNEDQALFQAIRDLKDPLTSIPLEKAPLETKIMHSPRGQVYVTLAVKPDLAEKYQGLCEEIRKRILAVPFVSRAQVILTHHDNKSAPKTKPPQFILPKTIANMIAVASGKGGVGKSTVSVLLAKTLKEKGHKVGLLDADIHGPSLPRLLGLSGKPTSKDGKTWEPMMVGDIPTMSIGSLLEADTPAYWRGPMVQTAFMQLLCQVNWGTLDTLIIDMPPGTGDISLALVQKVPLRGVVLVTTPQRVAWDDTLKSLRFFQKFNIPIFGGVVNMSHWLCENCHHENFNPEYEPFLGNIGRELSILDLVPYDFEIQMQCDHGNLISQGSHSLLKTYESIYKLRNERFAS